MTRGGLLYASRVSFKRQAFIWSSSTISRGFFLSSLIIDILTQCFRLMNWSKTDFMFRKHFTEAYHFRVVNTLWRQPPCNRFVYKSLCTATCIRLIKFDPQTTLYPLGKEVSFTLHTFELNSTPPYNALSYIWGTRYAYTCLYISRASIPLRQLTVTVPN